MATLKIPSPLRSQAGGKTRLTIEGHTVLEVILAAVEQYPELRGALLKDGSLHSFLNVYLNREDIRLLEGAETPVSDSDEITVLQPIAGG